MNKYLMWSLIGIGVLALGLFTAFQVMQAQTKKLSPEERVAYNRNETNLSVFYNRPYKKGRQIFGGLVPYGEVWRTGANEATTFTTDRDLRVGGKTLPAGKYTLWTIPWPDSWIVIFNEKQYPWGVGWGGKPSRDPAADVLQVEVPSTTLQEPVEQFTISFSESDSLALVMAWDRTRVEVPLE